jgi:uncharacterized protein (TIGR02145 family)
MIFSNSSTGTIGYAVSHPTTFICRNEYGNYDWYYTGSSDTDNTRWTESSVIKSIYDPCPLGWRVPDGDSNSLWTTAVGSTIYIEDFPYNQLREGVTLTDIFGGGNPIWYPAAGYRSDSSAALHGVGTEGNYWSATPYSNYSYFANYFYFNNTGRLYFPYQYYRGSALSVRCVQE